MAQFAPVYSDDQKDSIAAAIVDKRQGVKVARDAVRFAAAGQLVSVQTGEPLEPFTMPLTTAQALARDERNRRKGEHVPDWIRERGTDQAIEELGVRLVAIAAHEINRVSKQAEGKRDLDRARRAGQVLREARALTRGDAPKQGSAQRQARKGQAPEGDDATSAAAQLVQALRDEKRGETPHTDDTRAESAHGDGDGTSTHDEPTHDGDAGGINADAGAAQREREAMAAELGISTHAGAGTETGEGPDVERD